jgi:hypothetical protein
MVRPPRSTSSIAADLRTGIESRLLMEFDTDQRRNYLNVGNITTREYYELYNQGSLRLETLDGSQEIPVPSGTQTWGGSEFRNVALREFYWDAREDGNVQIASCNRNIRIFSLRIGLSSDNCVYYLNKEQIKTKDGLSSTQPELVNAEQIRVRLCQLPS